MKWQRQYWGGINGRIWFLRTDSGDSANILDDDNRVRLHADDSNIWMGFQAGTLLGTYNGFLTKINMAGAMQWQKVFGSTLGTNGDIGLSAALDEWFGINPNVSGEIAFVGVVDDSSTDRWRVGTLDSDGDTGLERDAGYTSPAVNGRPFNGMRVCSNGDVWTLCVQSSTDLQIQLLDRSDSFDSTVTETKVNTFGTTATNSRIEDCKTSLMSDDTLVVVGETTDSPPRIAIMKITTAGTCTAVDFYKLNDTDDNCVIIMQCTDGNDNIYVFWNQTDDSAATDTYYLSKFNSSLSHQWTVSLDNDIEVGNTVLSTKASIAASPDNNKVYVCVGEYVGGGDGSLLDDSKIVAINTSDGSKHKEWNIDTNNVSGSEDLIGACTIACNSKDIFLGMYWQNSSGDEVGYGLLRCPQHYWDRSGLTIDKLVKSPSNAVTVASTTAPTVASKTVTKSSLSTTQSTVTDLASTDSDSLTRTFTERPIWKAVY